MKKTESLRATALTIAMVLTCLPSFGASNPEEKVEAPEVEKPPVPALNLKQLVKLEMPAFSELSYAIDTQSVSIGPDYVVRYVLVAISQNGTVNASFEGIRCTTAEVKTYARYSVSQWNEVKEPAWRSLYDTVPSRHARAFAVQGACQGASAANSVKAIIAKLRDRTP